MTANKTQTNPEATLGKTLTFNDLWTGDRFSRVGVKQKDLWTKIGPDLARQHSPESQKLGARGHGYIGDAICSFEKTDIVEFVPVS